MANPVKKQPYPDFGKWLTYAESVQSATALAHGIDNTPTPQQYARMKLVYQHVYAPLCEHFGFKLPVTSFFRNKRLNELVGGSSTSEHMQGGAIDIDMQRSPRPQTNNQVFERARQHLNFDQLIFENPNPKTNVPGWVHIAYRPGGNRMQIKRMIYNPDGEKVYQFWPWEGGSLAVAVVTLVVLSFIYLTRTVQ